MASQSRTGIEWSETERLGFCGIYHLPYINADFVAENSKLVYKPYIYIAV